MKRTGSQELGEQAEHLFPVILGSDWIPRKQHPDYGVDYEVEYAPG
ncbi:unnamed protein product, partial [marine sediment metagenome]